jgi:type II secretory pathway pseudopilin PulG
MILPIAIVAFLAAIAIPNVLTAMQRSKQKRTMADIRSLATAIEAYWTDHPQWAPATITGSAAKLAGLLQPVYIKHIPLSDGWSRPLYVSVRTLRDGKEPTVDYMIWSYGRDGKRAPKWEGAFTTFDGDMVYANGTFITFPEGT